MRPPSADVAPAERGAGRLGRILLVAAVLTGLVSALSPGAGHAQPIGGDNDPFGRYTPVMLVVDTSGSMNDQVEGANRLPGTRLDVAKSALISLANEYGGDQRYGLIAYPGAGEPDDDGCSIGDKVLDLGSQHTEEVSAAIRRLSADGETPTGAALQHAADELRRVYGDDSRGVIMLFSDGEANCGSVPVCDVAKNIRATGLDVQINIVGLKLEDEAGTDMACAAEATGGLYTDVDGMDELLDAMAGATRAALELRVDPPDQLALVAGTGSSGTSTFAVTVSSTGRVSAADVRITLQLLSDETPGVVTVPRPVRFLGNLAVGASRTVEFGVRPDISVEGVSWRVTATAANAAARELTAAIGMGDAGNLSGVLAEADRVVVLGDSYSSGEGIGVYDGTPRGSDCHRSTAEGYAGRLFGADATVVIACSSAVTADLYAPQKSGDVSVPPQLRELRREVLGEDPPDAVFLSIGGNDADFGTIATRCVIFGLPSCQSFLPVRADSKGFVGARTKSIERAMDVQEDITDALRAVDAAANGVGTDGIPRTTIPIIVVPYPRIIPASATSGAGGCMAGISRDELTYLNRFIDTLNTSVTLAAYQVAGEGRPVYPATDVIESFQPHHTICDGAQSWAVTVPIEDALRNPGTAAAQALVHRPELLHPNRAGHDAMARAIAAWSRGTAAQPRDYTSAPEWDWATLSREPSTLVHVARTALQITRSVLQAGSQFKVERRGFLPGSPVTIRLHSSPTTLGTATADDTGAVSQWVRLPHDVPIGRHTVVVSGVDEDGELVAAMSSVKILPVGGGWLYVMLAAGAVALALGTIGRPWRRRPR